MIGPTEARRAERTRVAGLSVRTSNADESNPATGRIPGLWNRFMEEDLSSQLEHNGAFGPTIAAYHNYASDVSGEYRLLVGREIPIGTGIPAELDSVEIPAGRYFLFTFTGEIPGVVIEGWQQVWEYFAMPESAERAYTVDLEVYRGDGTGVEMWIAVR